MAGYSLIRLNELYSPASPGLSDVLSRSTSPFPSARPIYVCPERFYAFGFVLNARLNFSLFPGDISISGPTGENESIIVFYTEYSCRADSPYFGTPPYIFPEV